MDEYILDLEGLEAVGAGDLVLLQQFLYYLTRLPVLRVPPMARFALSVLATFMLLVQAGATEKGSTIAALAFQRVTYDFLKAKI
jgi:hypothetical protein